MFKSLYVLSPLVSVILAAKGYPAKYIAVGAIFSVALLLLDTFMIARRMLAATGSSGTTTQFLSQMAKPLTAMIVPATIWNAAGYGVGWIISQFIPSS